MNCPICNVTLLLAEKQGVEIDYCPKCRGIWLDRGELEKIVEKSNQFDQTQYPEKQYDKPFDKHYDDHDDHHYTGNQPYKRKKGFLGDLFDF
jgi:Zn-finger nucleic acid-binding protein